MEMVSSGEELIVKMRKPYTITKQREKWSEEEHIRFLEALKLYGRAWQRIKEHIGTKTAVQIRSHAQKFFAKLEKEALIKGVPLGQASDIDIPPPRPKRKPCSPYPRKTGVGSLFPSGGATDEKPPMSASSMSTSEQVIDMESNEPQEIPAATETLQRGNKASEDSSCSEVLNLFQDATAASISSTNKTSSNPCTCTEFAPVMKEIKENAALDESSRSVEVKVELKVTAREETSKKTSQQDDQSFSTAATNQVGLHVSTNSLVNPTVSATPEFCTYSEMSSIHQSFPVFQPFTLFHSNQDAYPSFHNISSTLSNLIMTTLLQNPAVHAAASLAATFWPSGDVETPVTEIQERQYNPSPNLATVAASTVAAASAWWATQGLLPLFPPLHPWFAFAPPPTNTIPVTDVSEAPRGDREGVDNPIQNPSREDQQVLNPEQYKRLILSASTSESDEIRRGEILHFSELKASKISNFKPSSDTGSHNPDKARSKKLDRSSCGSNMPSSSEVETDAIVQKHEEAKCEARHVHSNCPPAGESNNRRFRSSGIMNESWKEVSEEGRVAFRALFNRQVLPQTFSPPQTGDGIVKIGIDKEATALRFDLSKEACTTTDLHDVQGLEKEIVRSGGGIGHGSLTSETGQEKLKARRTGFKPYKRCSVEAKESGSKRMRLEGEAST